MYGLSRHALLMVLLLGPSLASAQFIDETFSGTISGGSTIDTSGIFGVAGANLNGLSYTTNYVVDPATAIDNFASHESSFEGLVSASITINGATLFLPTSSPSFADEIVDDSAAFGSATEATASNDVASLSNGVAATSVDATMMIPLDVRQTFTYNVNSPSTNSAGGTFSLAALGDSLSLILSESSVTRELVSAPEIDPASTSGALSLLLGSIVVIRGRRRCSSAPIS